jgi:hypothetical protein
VFTDRLDRHDAAELLVRLVRAQCDAARS